MLLVAVLVTTLLVNVPNNTEQLTWNVQAPPADWTSVRDRWHIAHAARTGAAVLTLWEEEKAVEELEASPLYRQTVEAILGSDLLAREQSVELFEVHAGKVVAGELAARLR
jgi:hypothetical protein